MKFNFTDAHYMFLEDEFNVKMESLLGMSEDELDNIYNDVCEIEIDETMKNINTDLSERGKLAAEIVNIMADALGYVQDEDFYFEDELGGFAKIA